MKYCCIYNFITGDIAFLEADIVLGHIIGSEDGPPIPIMAHPPANTSDLSLAHFLASIDDYNKNSDNPKGVKLDFKSIEAFEASQEQIEPFSRPEVRFMLIYICIFYGILNPRHIPPLKQNKS